MNRRIYLFRMEDGKKVRYRFELDGQMVIQEEVREGEDTVPVKRGPVQTNIEKRPDGTKVITSVSKEDQEILKFFVDSVPCWFEGCEELRKEWNEAVAKAGGEKCVGCARGRIMRQFNPRVRELLFPNEPDADA